MTAAYVAAPESPGLEAFLVLAPIIGIGAILFGLARHRPDTTTPWAMIAFALGSLAGAQVMSFPSLADAFHGGFWALLVASTVSMIRDVTPKRDASGGSEIGIVAVAVAVGVWLIVVEPELSGSHASLAATMWAGVIPLVGGLTFAAAVRLAATRGFGEYSSVALMAGIALQTVADVLRGTQAVAGESSVGGVAAGLAVFAPLVIASAALDPTMAASRPAAASSPELVVARKIGLSVAVLTPLTVLLALSVGGLGSTTTLVVVSVASVASVVLALARMWRLLDAVGSLTERRGQDRLAAMVEHSSDVVMLVDETGDIGYASPGLAGTLGHRSDDWIGRPLIDLIAEEDRAKATEEFDKLHGLGRDRTVRFESSVVRVDGQRRRMEATFANLIGGDAVDGIVATFRDVTDQRDLERKLSHQAFHDELTGLANRALFLDRMDHALRVSRTDADPVVVLFVDLDDFKSVNDALGHAVGDQLLRTIADRVRATSGTGDTPARLGGDEFALLLEDRGGIDRALDLAERLLDGLRQPVRLAGYDLTVLASVGVAVAAPGMTTSSLLRDADIAMYEAKRAGKGQIKIFDPAMRLGASTQLEYRSELGLALERDELRLVFQPIVDLRTGGVTGAEALVRWRHPTRGEVPPAEFVPIAERSGLIKDIGNWVLHRAMSEAVRWQVRGARTISINVSVVQLRVDGFVDQVREALESTGLAPDRVVLEITEAVLVDQIEDGASVLAELRSLGVRIAIDNFGTSYCSLSYFQRFPVDVVKIDRRFVDLLDSGAPAGSDRVGLAQMILQVTAAAGVTSVAEGIERTEQIDVLRGLGCDLGQGILLSPPLEVEMINERFGTDGASGTRMVGTV